MMILVAGGTGTLGTQVVRRLTGQGLQARVMTRDLSRARHLEDDLVEIVPGDVLDPASIERAIAGARTVVSAIHGFAGIDARGPQAVDQQGNSHLIRTAEAAGIEHFILLSVQGAAPDHPMELFRMKHLAEEELRGSRLSWTVIRPTAYMETWARLVGEPLVKTGRTRIFGRGDNPINFVSAHDVAGFVALAVVDPAMRGETVEVGGPDNLSMKQVARTFETETGKRGKISHVPLPMMRLMSVLMRPINPTLARQIQAGVVMDTADMTFDASEIRRRYPTIPVTTLAEVVRRDYLDGSPAS